MFRFESPEYLYILIAIPLLVLLFWFNQRLGARRLRRLGKAEYVRRMMPDVSKTRVWAKFGLLMGVLVCIILMMARPQMGMRMKTDTTTGLEVVVAMDVSNSMKATDVEPTRLDKAKRVVSSLCSRLSNDKIALVIFAGNAFLQMPMSADNVSVDMFLDAINTGMIPVQGTSIAEALAVANGSFSKQKDVKRAVVLITDGEDHEGGVEEVLSELKSKDIQVYVLGIGDTKGSPIKTGNDYMRDRQGNMVITRLNEEMCKTIAQQANGMYIHIDNSNSAQDQLVDELNQLQRSKLDTVSYEEYNELFPQLAILALILLVLEVLVIPRKSHYFDNVKFFNARSGVRKTMMLVALMTVSATAMAQSQTKVQTHKGNRAMERRMDSLAVIHYKKAIAFDSTNYKAHYNLGNAYFRQSKGEEAMREYETSARMAPSKTIKAAIHHNRGVLCYAAQMYDKAVDAFKESLRANPKDNRTRYNLALAQYMLKKNPPQNQGQNQQKNDKQGDDENKQDQQQQNQQQKDQQQQQEQKQDMSKQNAEQMLRAAQMKERQTQEKLKHKQVPATRRHFDKNW